MLSQRIRKCYYTNLRTGVINSKMSLHSLRNIACSNVNVFFYRQTNSFVALNEMRNIFYKQDIQKINVQVQMYNTDIYLPQVVGIFFGLLANCFCYCVATWLYFYFRRFKNPLKCKTFSIKNSPLIKQNYIISVQDY